MLVLAGLNVPLAAGAFALGHNRIPITRENFERIQPVMSRAAVEAILGPAAA